MKIKAVYKVACSIKWPHTQKMPGDVEDGLCGRWKRFRSSRKGIGTYQENELYR